jgi:uncharacterized protein with PIN domain
MTIRLYIDEDAMDHALVRGLRTRGVDVATVEDSETNGDDDRSQLIYATQQRRVLYTRNLRDFCQLHDEYMAEGRQHTGIIVIYRQRYSVGEQIRRLLALIQDKSAEDMENVLHFL